MSTPHNTGTSILDHALINVDVGDGDPVDEVQEDLDIQAAQSSFSEDNNWQASPLSSSEALVAWNNLQVSDQLNVEAIDEQSQTVAKSTEEAYKRYGTFAPAK
jgi:hypothetical protein